jgi:outer membrane protein OmpA-like peptidoglycan-associated protein
VFLRKLSSGLVLAAVMVASAAAQTPTTTTTRTTAITQDEIVLQGDATPRFALPTIQGDTGFWFVPTAETLPHKKVSFSVFRSNFDRRQGLTDINQFGVTGAVGIKDRFEIFGSWRVVRVDRDVLTFVPESPIFGGVSQDYPYVRRSWSGNLGGPLLVGAKWGILSQSRGDAMSLAPRIAMTFPSGSTWASTNDLVGQVDLVGSREFGKVFELSGTAGGVLRGDPDEFKVSDGIGWGIGASFPSRSSLRAIVEWTGEFVINANTLVLTAPFTGEDGSIAPLLSPISDPTDLKMGLVWQSKKGFFAHGGLNYSAGTGGQLVAGRNVGHTGWGLDLRLGWHPGVVPARERVRTIKETTTVTNTVTTPAPVVTPPRVNRNPDLGVGIACNPCVVEVGRTSQLTATATDPDGDAVTLTWSAPQGSFSSTTGPNTIWTAPGQPANVPVTVVATDTAGGRATATTTLQVIRRTELVFEDVHFDFDRFNLRPDALKILDDAVAKLQANPDIQVTLEGHCDSIGSQQYNIALGERRASSARDYLVSRGIAASRLRTVTYGEDRPIADNNTAPGRAQNRRAHLVVVMTQ